MKQEQQQTANDETPPVPQFDFGEKPKRTAPGETVGERDQDAAGNDDQTGGPGSSTEGDPEEQLTEEDHGKGGTKRGKSKAKKTQQKFRKKHYVNLSTKARRSIQRALDELSHRRKKSKPNTIKHFIEEAISEWSISKRAKVDYVPKDAELVTPNDEDPRETFNNEIEEELKDLIGDICHERGKIDHPVSTIIAVVDDAFCQWLPKQPDLPKKYLIAVLGDESRSGGSEESDAAEETESIAA